MYLAGIYLASACISFFMLQQEELKQEQFAFMLLGFTIWYHLEQRFTQLVKIGGVMTTQHFIVQYQVLKECTCNVCECHS